MNVKVQWLYASNESQFEWMGVYGHLKQDMHRKENPVTQPLLFLNLIDR